jgi:hypothetical protein
MQRKREKALTQIGELLAKKEGKKITDLQAKETAGGEFEELSYKTGDDTVTMKLADLCELIKQHELLSDNAVSNVEATMKDGHFVLSYQYKYSRTAVTQN